MQQFSVPVQGHEGLKAIPEEASDERLCSHGQVSRVFHGLLNRTVAFHLAFTL